MKTRDSSPLPLPPPVHVHVPGSTPVHVHMRRSPSQSAQTDRKLLEDSGVEQSGGHVSVIGFVESVSYQSVSPTDQDHRPPGEGGGSGAEGPVPLDPPGRLSCQRHVDSQKCQRRRGQRQQSGGRGEGEEKEEDVATASRSLRILLQEQEGDGRLKKSDSQGRRVETDALLRALVEAEIDGVAVANQLSVLKGTIDSLAKNKGLSKLQAASLGRQQMLLLEKIEMFDNTNQSLRELLREWSQLERDSLLCSGQTDALKTRLADSEAENVRLTAKLTRKEKEAAKLAEHLDFERDTAKTTEELSRIVESTRHHLESQLSRAEAEKVQLAAQIQRMQQSQEQQQQKLQALQDQLQAERQQRDQEKEVEKQGGPDQEALVLLTQQAERAEEAAREQTEKLKEKETQLAQALSTSSDWCLRHSREAAAKAHLEEEVSALKLQEAELKAQLRSADERSRAEREELRDQLQHLSAQNAATRLDSQRLQVELTSSEEKLRGIQSEARQLKASIRKYENLVEKYKKKVQHSRLQSEQHCLKLEVTQRELREVELSLERETGQVRRELLARLRELEPLPERLRRTEQQLRGAQQEADAHERRSAQHTAVLSEVRHKVEQQGAQLETLQQKNLLLQEENNVHKEKIHNLERKLEDMKVENRELSQELDSKEAVIRSVQQQLEEKSCENSVLSTQLQQTLDDAQRQVDHSIQRVLAKERTSQCKALDLQSQLSRARTELSQLQRSKEETERRLQSQLQNMKDRLEQSDSTNRSLHNYLHFLKTSYGNVFGDFLPTSRAELSDAPT